LGNAPWKTRVHRKMSMQINERHTIERVTK
jgi:hypothetical protein